MQNKKLPYTGVFLFSYLFSICRSILFFLFRANAQKQIQQNAENGSACHAGNFYAKERNIAAKSILPAEANDHDGCDYSDILRAEHIDILIDHDGDALCRNSAKEENLKAADDRRWDGVDSADKGRKAGNDHCDDGRGHQHRDGEDLGDGHGADIFAVVGAARPADGAGDHIANAVADQVEAKLALDVIALFGAFLFGQVVDVNIKLINMRGGFRNGRQGDGHNCRNSHPGRLGQRDMRKCKNASACDISRNLFEEVDAGCERDNERGDTAYDGAEQQRKLAQHAFEIDREENRGDQRNEGDKQRHIGDQLRISGCCCACAGIDDGRSRIAQRISGKRQADDHGDGASNAGGQGLFHGVFAEAVDDEAGGDGDEARHDNAKLRHSDLLIQRCADKRFAGHQTADCGQIGKARAIVERELFARDEQKAQRRKAACENRR